MYMQRKEIFDIITMQSLSQGEAGRPEIFLEQEDPKHLIQVMLA